jgi:sigma-B regulation protein RsbU (phosphoserine phosphatase)
MWSPFLRQAANRASIIKLFCKSFIIAMQSFYWELRRKLQAAELWPEGRMARIACYLFSMGVVLYLLRKLVAWMSPAWAEAMSGWAGVVVFLAAVLFSILAFRWLKKRLLWRLRNRLIVTYVFIGVIPAVLLVAMASITIYLFAGQFASFVVTSEINAQLRSLGAVNAAVSNELAARIERGENASAESLAGLKKRDRAWGRRQVCAWYGAKPLLLATTAQNPNAFDFPEFFNKPNNPYFLANHEGQPFREIVRDRGELHLRVTTVLSVGPELLTVVTTEPVDKELLGNIASDLGEITLYASGLTPRTPSATAVQAPPEKKSGPPASISIKPSHDQAGIVINTRGEDVDVKRDDQDLRPTFTVGTLAAPTGAMDREITFGTPLRVVDWKTGESARAGALVRVRTRPSILYGHLFASLGDFAKGVEFILLAVLIFFALIELIALIIGMRMTRTVTGAVAQLYDATKHVDQGDFSHRIPVQSADQLSQLSLSFNSMTGSIEKLIQEQKEKQRLEGELAIAQEVQSQLFPRQVSELESLEVHGFCRPARTVSGDYYDFLTASSHKLILAVGDISGKGISAALLMATIHSAVRAYSVESLPQMREPVALGAVAGAGRIMAAWPEGIEVSPGALLGLLNHQLYESTPPEKYATLFLAIYDGRSHQLTYSNGGHLPPILIATDGSLRRLESGGTVVGLFEHVSYDEGVVQMRPGEILVAYSDGITEPENDFGEFGEERLIQLVRANRTLPLPQISQSVTAAVDDWIGDQEQPDDVTLVLARAR